MFTCSKTRSFQKQNLLVELSFVVERGVSDDSTLIIMHLNPLESLWAESWLLTEASVKVKAIHSQLYNSLCSLKAPVHC